MRDTIYSMITEYVENMTDRFASTEADPEEWDIKVGCESSQCDSTASASI